MKKIFTLAMVIFFTALSYAEQNTNPQDSLKTKPGTYRYNAWIETIDSPGFREGQIFLVEDSALTFVQQTSRGKIQLKETIKPENLDVIKIRKQGSVGTGIAIGLASGVAAGIIASIAIKKPEPVQNSNGAVVLIGAAAQGMAYGASVFMIGFSAALVGITVGAIIGSAKKTIAVHASRAEYEWQKTTLNKYSIYNNTDLHVTKLSKLKQYITDIDSNAYPTVALGGQVWMSEDLKVTRFRDSSMIIDESGKHMTAGEQYSWLAVNNSAPVCPVGWHVPSAAEWNSLVLSLGGYGRAPERLSGSFTRGKSQVGWWSSTSDSAGKVAALFIDIQSSQSRIIKVDKNATLPVRCIRDTIR